MNAEEGPTPDDFLEIYAANRFDPEIDIKSPRFRLASDISSILANDGQIRISGVPTISERLGQELVSLIQKGDFETFGWIAKNLRNGLSGNVELEVIIDALEYGDGLPDNKEFEARVKAAGGQVLLGKSQQRKKRRLGIYLPQSRRGGKKGIIRWSK